MAVIRFIIFWLNKMEDNLSNYSNVAVELVKNVGAVSSDLFYHSFYFQEDLNLQITVCQNV